MEERITKLERRANRIGAFTVASAFTSAFLIWCACVVITDHEDRVNQLEGKPSKEEAKKIGKAKYEEILKSFDKEVDIPELKLELGSIENPMDLMDR